jgi:ribokinase
MAKDIVLVIGSLNYDYILRTDHLPRKGETLTAESFEICPGGKGGNQAVQCAKLGLKTYMAAAVGDDFMGDFLYKGLAGYGVDVSHVRKEHGASGFAMACAAGKGNLFAAIVKGTNNCFTEKNIDALDVLFEKAVVVIVQMEIPISVVEYCIRKGKEKACIVVINTAPAKEIDRKSLVSCDYVIMNEVEAQFYCGISDVITRENAGCHAEQLSAEFNNIVIITLGGDGVTISVNGGPSKYFRAFDITALETTGAGDSFIGGVAYGIIKNMPLEETMAFASCCSAVTIQKPGGQPAMPLLDQVTVLLPQYKP